jgi:Endonuclease NucS
MLERQMEEAIAACPDLFIEPGLTLVRRQVVINGRRPDVLFTDVLSRHLLVEIQCGRLDEDHLQRHFYYYFDYRAKYPTNHLRLMFIANRFVPQHKEFLDEHGYEFREYPENEFERKLSDCMGRMHPVVPEVETVTTPGVLAPSTYGLLYEIEMQPMTLCYKMLLLIAMSELADATGRVSLTALAERFRDFFVSRSVQNKAEENLNRVKPGILSGRSIQAWERVIRDQPVHYLTESFVLDEGTHIVWAPRIWSRWNPDLQREVRSACFDRLVRYFNKHVPGGY